MMFVMKNRSLVHYSGRLTERANAFIAQELKSHGVEDIAPCHGDILIQLYKNDGALVTELARRARRTKSTMSVMVDKLEKLGYVRKMRNPEDNRAIGVYLTDKGLALRPTFEAISERLNAKVFSPLSEEEADQLETLMQKVLNTF